MTFHRCIRHSPYNLTQQSVSRLNQPVSPVNRSRQSILMSRPQRTQHMVEPCYRSWRTRYTMTFIHDHTIPCIFVLAQIHIAHRLDRGESYTFTDSYPPFRDCPQFIRVNIFLSPFFRLLQQILCMRQPQRFHGMTYRKGNTHLRFSRPGGTL